MEIKSGSNEHPKTTILQMKILKLKKSVFNIQRGDLLCPFSAFFWQIRSIYFNRFRMIDKFNIDDQRCIMGLCCDGQRPFLLTWHRLIAQCTRLTTGSTLENPYYSKQLTGQFLHFWVMKTPWIGLMDIWITSVYFIPASHYEHTEHGLIYDWA